MRSRAQLPALSGDSHHCPVSRPFSSRPRSRRRTWAAEPLDPLLRVWLPTHIPEAFLPNRRRGRVPSGALSFDIALAAVAIASTFVAARQWYDRIGRFQRFTVCGPMVTVATSRWRCRVDGRPAACSARGGGLLALWLRVHRPCVGHDPVPSTGTAILLSQVGGSRDRAERLARDDGGTCNGRSGVRQRPPCGAGPLLVRHVAGRAYDCEALRV